MAFGFLGKMASGLGKAVGINKPGGRGGVNAAPSGNFWNKFKQNTPGALNNAAQIWGGQMAPMARMTGMMKRPGNSANTPAAQNAQNPGINTAPSGMMMPQSPMGLFRPQVMPPMTNGGFTGMGMPPDMGGNTGFAGGLFNRPRLDPTSGQYTMPSTPQTGGIWDAYNRMSGLGNDESVVPGRRIFT